MPTELLVKEATHQSVEELLPEAPQLRLLPAPKQPGPAAVNPGEVLTSEAQEILGGVRAELGEEVLKHAAAVGHR